MGQDPQYGHKEPQCEDRDPPKRPYMGTWGQEELSMGTGTCRVSLYDDMGTGRPQSGDKTPDMGTRNQM